VKRILFVWRGVPIGSYPACLFIGVNFGIVLQNWAAHVVGANGLRVYIATLLLLPAALIGSRLLFVAGRWRYFLDHPEAFWRRSGGGMSMLGAIPLMVSLSIPLLAQLEVPFWQFWDLSIFCILGGMACTRVGCLLNGCCAGKEARHSFTLNLPNTRGVWARRYPTQILEGMVAIMLLMVAAIIYPSIAHQPGALFLIMLGAYGVLRLGLQTLREDRQWLGPFDLQHIMAAGMIAFAALGLALVVG
jgi:prolipoprotein diacylglyceryltransferase